MSLVIDNIDIPDIFFCGGEMPSPPSPSTFYGLRPIGVGTSSCESLKSYVERLADSHNLCTYKFMKEVVVYGDRLGINGISMLTYRGMWSKSYISAFLGVANTSKNISSLLEITTKVDGLHNCTFSPLAHVLNWYKLINVKRRYCAMCYENCDDYRDLYGRLIWEVECVKACPLHGVNLIEAKCGADEDKVIDQDRRKFYYGICSRCGSIGYKCNRSPLIKSSEYDIAKSRLIADLIATIPIASEIYTKESAIDGLMKLADIYDGGNKSKLAQRIGVSKSSYCLSTLNKHNIKLDTLADLCMASGTTIIDTLMGKPVKVYDPQAIPLKDKREKLSLVGDVILKELMSAKNTFPPCSLYSLAKKLDVHEKTLKATCPELCKEILDRYRNYSEDNHLQKMQDEKNYAMMVIRQLKDKGLTPSQRNIYKITKITHLGSKNIYRYICENW